MCCRRGTIGLRVVSLTICFALLPAAGLANTDTIDEIAVTATPRPAHLRDISAALTRIPGDAVADSALLTDALQGNAGISVQRTTPGQGAAIIRGLKGSSVLHLVDGMRLNNAIFRSAPTQYLALVPTTAVDRVEVIRGTPAGLYGSEAIAGVVHVIPRRPSFDSATTEIHRHLAATLESADLRKALRGGIDAGNRELVASVSAEYAVTGNRRTGAGRLPTRGYSSRAARAFVAAVPSDTETWSVDLQWLEQPETPRADELIAGFGQSQPSSSEFYFEPNARLFAHLQHDRLGGPLDLDWRFDLAWQRIEDDRRTREFESSVRTLEQNRSDLFGARVDAGADTGETSWTVGAEAYRDEVRSRRSQTDLGSGLVQSVLPRFPDDSSIAQAAVFASAARPLATAHRINAGVRFNAVDIELPAGEGRPAASIATRRWSGDIGWVYDATSDWQVAANLGFGFRAPNIFDLGTLGSRPGNRFNVPNTGLDAETVVHADVGIRYASERSRLEVAVFVLDYDNRITSASTGEVTADGRDIVRSVNAASSSIRGIEFGLRRRISERIELEASATYTRGDQRVTGEASEPADRIPPLSGRIALTAGPFRHWTLRGSIDWAGAQDRLSARDVRDVRIDPAGTPGWGDLGASATWHRGGGWRVTLAASNLLDKRYRSHGSGLDEPGRSISAVLQRAW